MWNISLPHWWEFVLRAMIVYGFLLLILRLTGKRQVGQLAPFDLVLSYLYDPEAIFATNLQRAGVTRLVQGPAKIVGPEHAAAQLAKPLAALGIPAPDPARKSGYCLRLVRSLLSFPLQPGSRTNTLWFLLARTSY